MRQSGVPSLWASKILPSSAREPTSCPEDKREQGERAFEYRVSPAHFFHKQEPSAPPRKTIAREKGLLVQLSPSAPAFENLAPVLGHRLINRIQILVAASLTMAR